MEHIFLALLIVELNGLLLIFVAAAAGRVGGKSNIWRGNGCYNINVTRPLSNESDL